MKKIAVYSSPEVVTVTTAGYYYVKVQPYSGGDTGNYKIRIYDDTSSTLFPISTSYTSGNIALLGSDDWYIVYLEAGHTYYIQWDDDYDGSGTTDIDVKVSMKEDSDSGTAVFTGEDSGYSSPKTVTPSVSKFYYIQVEPYSILESGTYKLRVYE